VHVGPKRPEGDDELAAHRSGAQDTVDAAVGLPGDLGQGGLVRLASSTATPKMPGVQACERSWTAPGR
jgi:hypothetical protein